MLDSERNSHETDTNQASGHQEGNAGPAPAAPQPSAPVAPAVPAAVFQAPQVLFQAPAPPAAPPSRDYGSRDSGTRDSGARESGARDSGGGEAADGGRPSRSRTRASRSEAEARHDQPAGEAADGGQPSRGRTRTSRGEAEAPDDQPGGDADGGRAPASRRSRRGRGGRVRDAGGDDALFPVESTDAAGAVAEADSDETPAGAAADDDYEGAAGRRRRRRTTRSRTRAGVGAGSGGPVAQDADEGDEAAEDAEDGDQGDDGYAESGVSRTRRRRKRRRGSADVDVTSPDDPPDTVVHVREAHSPLDDVRSIKGSTRLEAKKQRRREGRESGRRRPPIVTESEFLARRESVERSMVVRQRGDRTQIAVLEDGVLVEHYVNRASHASYVGNVYLGKVQNVLPSMEAAFVDIGKGRNAVLYAGEVNFDASGLEGQPKRIESALKPGQSVIVQVTKDPVGHKGARLTSQVSLPGRYLVYVPGASMTGISRKLPDTERNRLKAILKKVTPENAGVIVRTAAEGAAEAELDRDISRLAAQWENIEKKAKTASAPSLLYGEPDLTIRVVRDVFNEDFSQLIVSGEEGWEVIDEYVRYVAPHLADRLSRWNDFDGAGNTGPDAFAEYRIDEQLAKALERKVWLPSGGSLVIDRTEAMTVIDVNTGKFTGQGGNLEETVTRNNLEAAEEIVRQLRLRDVGGIVVIDFIDMVLESNRELVLRRLLECLARDRTKHQVAEVTSLGLVQMTRKRVGAGLLEAFSTQCECCNGRGVLITLDSPAEPAHRASAGTVKRPLPGPPPGNGNGHGNAGNGGNGRSREGANGRGERPGRTDQGAGRQANGRSGSRPDARGTLADAPLSGDMVSDAAVDESLVADLGTEAAPTAAGSATPGGSDNGARRTRRPTAGGTAFATAVHVEDTPAPVVVVPAAAPSAPPLSPETPDADAAGTTAVRRTRAGSAVARVTVAPTEPPADATAPEPEAPADPDTPATTVEPEALSQPEAAQPEVPADPEAAQPEAHAEPAALVEPEAHAELEAAAEPWALAEPQAAAQLAAPADADADADAPAEQEAPVDANAAVEPEPAVESAAPVAADAPAEPEPPAEAEARADQDEARAEADPDAAAEEAPAPIDAEAGTPPWTHQDGDQQGELAP
jgi:ribonuclease E